MDSWIKDLRMEKGMTQEQVARQVGIARTYYTIIENNRPARSPTVHVVQRIADVLGFPWERYYNEKSKVNRSERIG